MYKMRRFIVAVYRQMSYETYESSFTTFLYYFLLFILVNKWIFVHQCQDFIFASVIMPKRYYVVCKYPIVNRAVMSVTATYNDTVIYNVVPVSWNHRLLLCTGTPTFEKLLVTESNNCWFAVVLCTSSA